MIASPLHATTNERRRRLQEAVAKLAKAIAAGDVTPLPVELDALAQLCDLFDLPLDAARVRRWIPEEDGDA